MGASAPIGVFDSGIGGLSVLRHIRALLPHESLLYFADSAFAPYGDRTERDIVARALAIAGFFQQQRAKALVVACNTATAAAITLLRERYPALPIVGVEPGLKPAATMSRSGVVGVLATQSTLSSKKFRLLQEQVEAAASVKFLAQACVGLADQIEKGELHSPQTARMVHGYVAPLLEQGADTLVLGCTHYPFVQPLLESIIAQTAAQPVRIVDTGAPVARQLQRLLAERALLNEQGEGSISACTTGSTSALETAFARLLKTEITAIPLAAR